MVTVESLPRAVFPKLIQAGPTSPCASSTATQSGLWGAAPASSGPQKPPSIRNLTQVTSRGDFNSHLVARSSPEVQPQWCPLAPPHPALQARRLQL